MRKAPRYRRRRLRTRGSGERGPAGAGLELLAGAEERVSAAGAGVRAGVVRAQEAAGEGTAPCRVASTPRTLPATAASSTPRRSGSACRACGSDLRGRASPRRRFIMSRVRSCPPHEPVARPPAGARNGAGDDPPMKIPSSPSCSAPPPSRWVTGLPTSPCPTPTGRHHPLAPPPRREPVILAFYPKAFTPGCTQQNQNFPGPLRRGVGRRAPRWWAISVDGVETQRKFKAEKYAALPAAFGTRAARWRSSTPARCPWWASPTRANIVVGEDGM